MGSPQWERPSIKVAVFGASGFVGATLVEHLAMRLEMEVKPIIHRAGNAWRLARVPFPMTTVDIMSETAVAAALDDCTHVVNCTRGSGEVMLTGLKNLLSASRSKKVQRFVHLSSVAVYGDPPAPETQREEAPPNPAPNSYGEQKLRQDAMVAAAAASGLDCVVLCPPNISGVYSGFVSNVLGDIRIGSFALIDDGAWPNNTVDVDNLAYAIMLALEVPKGDGDRIFVSDGVGYTWKDLADALGPLAEHSCPIPTIPASVLTRVPTPSRRPASLWRSAKHLFSSDVREALRRDPLWAKLDVRMRKLAAVGGVRMEDRLRQAIEGPQKVARVADAQPYASRYNAMQLRGVWHRIDRAREVLGYEPKIQFVQSTERFRIWYETMHGFGQPYWPLVRVLDAL